MASKLRCNDKVIILTGKDKGKIGTIKNIKSSNKVVVKGINFIKKHQKPVPSQNKSGGILEKEAPIHISNVAILNPASNKADRVGFRFDAGRKVRFFKSNQKKIT